MAGKSIPANYGQILAVTFQAERVQDKTRKARQAGSPKLTKIYVFRENRGWRQLITR